MMQRERMVYTKALVLKQTAESKRHLCLPERRSRAEDHHPGHLLEPAHRGVQVQVVPGDVRLEDGGAVSSPDPEPEVPGEPPGPQLGALSARRSGGTLDKAQCDPTLSPWLLLHTVPSVSPFLAVHVAPFSPPSSGTQSSLPAPPALPAPCRHVHITGSCMFHARPTSPSASHPDCWS